MPDDLTVLFWHFPDDAPLDARDVGVYYELDSDHTYTLGEAEDCEDWPSFLFVGGPLANSAVYKLPF